MTYLYIIIAVELLVVAIYGLAAWRRRLWHILIAADQLANTWIGGAAYETISTRAARQSHKRGWRALGRLLDRIDPGHMAKALEEPSRRPGWD